MKKFQDKTGGSWKIELTIGTVQRVKAESEGKFNLYEPDRQLDGQPLQQVLYDHPSEFWELLWHLVQPQAEAAQPPVSAEAFGELMAAECLVAAQVAFFGEWRDFFQSLQRPDRAKALEKLEIYQRKALELVTAKLEDPRLNELDQRVTQQMSSTLNAAFDGWLGSWASSLSDTPGGS